MVFTKCPKCDTIKGKVSYIENANASEWGIEGAKMKKLISAVLVIVFAILAMAIPAEAQNGRDRARAISSAIAGTDRDGYDVYDDRYNNYGRGDVQCQYDRYGRPYDCRRYDNRGYDRRGGWKNPVRDLAILGGVVGGLVITNKIIDNKNKREEALESAPTVYGGGQLYIENSTGSLARLVDNDQVVKEFNPGESVWIGLPTSGYVVLYLEMANGQAIWQTGKLAGNGTELKMKK